MSEPRRRWISATLSGVNRSGVAVVDRAERDAVVVDREQRVAQRKDLETARIGEDRPVPAGERVQPAELLDHVLAGAKVQVVGVAEDDARPHLPHLVGVQRLHGRLGADGHEGRRRDVAVGGVDDAGAGGAVARLEGEAGHRISIASPKE